MNVEFALALAADAERLLEEPGSWNRLPHEVLPVKPKWAIEALIDAVRSLASQPGVIEDERTG